MAIKITKTIWGLAICAGMALLAFSSSPTPCHATLSQHLITDQTSAGLYMNRMRREYCGAGYSENWIKNFFTATDTSQPPISEPRFWLTADLYTKAHSYACLNKLSFVLAWILGLAVIMWPALGIICKQSVGEKEWHKSPTVLTTLSALTGLMISVYSDYKIRQTSIENLMREVYYTSESNPHLLSAKIVEELSKIDNGFSFDSFKEKGKGS